MSDTVHARPRRLTLMCWALAAFVVLVFAAVGAGLRGSGETQFRLADQVAMTLLGVAIGSSALLLTRPRVEADATGICVRNVLGWRHFPWQVVAAVTLPDGASWASLELQDDDTVALLAVQTNDGEVAVDTVVALRRLLTASRS